MVGMWKQYRNSTKSFEDGRFATCTMGDMMGLESISDKNNEHMLREGNGKPTNYTMKDLKKEDFPGIETNPDLFKNNS